MSITFSDCLSLIAIIVSMSGVFITYKNHKENQILSLNQDRARNETDKIQTYLNKNNNRISMIPYFHLELDDSISIEEFNGEKYYILPITLINLGMESATNIQLIPLSTNSESNNYFKTNNPLFNNKHFLNSYFDKQYALAHGKVKFSVRYQLHYNAQNVYFGINFNDLIGRKYKQEFRFQYDVTQMESFSLNYSTSVPICIKDEDQTEEKL